MGEIRIEGKPYTFPYMDEQQTLVWMTLFLGQELAFDHLYLVYVDDQGSEYVIRGGPNVTAFLDFSVFGDIQVEVGERMIDSIDRRPASDRDDYGSRVLDLGGRDAEDVWAIMLQQAEEIANAKLPYSPDTQNSNSLVASVLHAVGIDVLDWLPDQPNGEADLYVAAENSLSEVDVFLEGNSRIDKIAGSDGDDVIYGYGGNDTLLGSHGSDYLHGGAGSEDIVKYSESLSNFSIVKVNEHTFKIVRDEFWRDSVDTLINVEFVEFNGTRYSLIEVPADNEETIDDAVSISFSNITIDDEVGGSDTADYYSFVATGSGVFTLQLNGLSDNLNLQLLDYQGNVLETSAYGGTSYETIGHSYGDGQLYYVRVYPSGSSQSDYNLSISITENSGGAGDGSSGGGSSDQPDLVVASFDVSASTVVAGGTLDFDWVVANIGGGDQDSSGRAGIYISTNFNITTSDTLLYDESFGSLDAGETNDEFEYDVQIPDYLASGTYYLGVIADHDDDVAEADEGNNVSSVVSLHVTGGVSSSAQPDIIVESLDVSETTMAAGDMLNFDWVVTNIGSAGQDIRGTAGIYLSSDSNIAQSDILLYQERWTRLEPGESQAETEAGVLVPASLEPGTYYIGVIADIFDDIEEANEGNNVSPIITIKVSDAADDLDFTATNFTAYTDTYTNSAQAGDTIDLAWTIRNIGSEDQDGYATSGVYLSTDSIVTSSDILLLEENWADLRSGESVYERNYSIALPADLESGTYYLAVLADHGNDVAESSEDNNTSNVITLEIRASQESLYGTLGADDLVGTVAGDEMSGNAGDDRLVGDGGNDTLAGDDGNDLLRGGPGHDLMRGGDGNDQIWAGSDDEGNDTVYGDRGADIVGGGMGHDLLIGGEGPDVLFGGGGQDVLIAGGWTGYSVTTYESDSNALWSGDGDDRLYGADGADAMGGGRGDDSLSGAGGNDILYAGATGDDHLNGGWGNDVIFGGSGADSVNGDYGDDEIYGGSGRDTMEGGWGNDAIFGGTDADEIDGDDGADTLRGGPGNDTISGGSGVDRFVFRAGDGEDLIQDFRTYEDVLILSGTNSEFSSLSDLESAASDTFDGLLLDLGGGDFIVLNGLSTRSLDNMNVVFD